MEPLAHAAVPSPSQRSAIEAAPGPLLVLAGPGAGKTYCLIERIRFLIEVHHFDPARICAFTFTNKAAGEITHRLEARLGAAAQKITRGTIHAFCAQLLRELGAAVLLEQGFGIADEDYQLSVLRRIEGPRRWHRNTLTRFSAHRFRGDPLMHDDLVLFEKYKQFLVDRRLVDFDTLVIKAAELLEHDEHARQVRARWDVILVDEFQDLNPVQYRVVRALAKDHRHVFGVGDDEQSIYSWAGADPRVFTTFVNDFAITSNKIHLEENRRCPSDVFAMARKLMEFNKQLFLDRIPPRADRLPTFPIRALSFGNEDAEASWLVGDVRGDRISNGHAWGDVALLYRKHEIGERLEAAFLNAGIPCRLAMGRALSDDPVVGYVIAASRVIANPRDDIVAEHFFEVVLPGALYDEAEAKAGENRIPLRSQLNRMAALFPRADENARQIRRALADYRNLVAVGKQHPSLGALIRELLSRRVGKQRSTLDEHHDEITDPAILGDVVALADKLRDARATGKQICIEPMGGIDIPLKGMLSEIGLDVIRAPVAPPGSVRIRRHETPSRGIALGVFKAAQLLEMSESSAAFTNFTAIDLETTDNDIRKAEIVEIAAVRVRDGKVTDQTLHRLVRPRVAISHGALETHGITEAEVATAQFFESVWPEFREFCGDDVIVAHNGYDFDFRVLHRMSRAAGSEFDLCTFDTLPLARDLFPTSRKLVDLAQQFGIDTGRSHRALDDACALAHVLLKLNETRLSRGRKTALVNLLDHLGVALALSDYDSFGPEGRLFMRLSIPFALGKFSDSLIYYEREQGDDESLPTIDTIINRLGGQERREKLLAEKSADERYPVAMRRLRAIIEGIEGASLDEQLAMFLERVVLSQWDGQTADRDRVNLLTLHSTKGLEFSRVYVVGAEDAQLPGGSPERGAKPEEIEEARRLLYVGMTRTIDRLIMTHTAMRGEKPTGAHRFLDEMGLVPAQPEGQ
jgi:DNA polymerase III epsilon subunit family exonuclease